MGLVKLDMASRSGFRRMDTYMQSWTDIQLHWFRQRVMIPCNKEKIKTTRMWHYLVTATSSAHQQAKPSSILSTTFSCFQSIGLSPHISNALAMLKTEGATSPSCLSPNATPFSVLNRSLRCYPASSLRILVQNHPHSLEQRHDFVLQLVLNQLTAVSYLHISPLRLPLTERQ